MQLLVQLLTHAFLIRQAAAAYLNESGPYNLCSCEADTITTHHWLCELNASIVTGNLRQAFTHVELHACQHCKHSESIGKAGQGLFL